MCREYQRGACKRAESECRFAHPADSVTANEDGTVTVCMDAVKGRCNRDPCRYFHPPLHLQAQIKAAQSRASAVCYAILVRTLATLFFILYYLSVCFSFLRLDFPNYTHAFSWLLTALFRKVLRWFFCFFFWLANSYSNYLCVTYGTYILTFIFIFLIPRKTNIHLSPKLRFYNGSFFLFMQGWPPKNRLSLAPFILDFKKSHKIFTTLQV